MKELLEIAAALKNLESKRCVLATVISVEGSAYRRPGARMLLTPDGQSWGMISGGCLEHDVLEHARKALRSGAPRIVRYDSTSEDDIIFGTGLGCNGIIDVFIEPVSEMFRESFIETVENCRQSRYRGAIATSVDNGNGELSNCQHAFLNADGWTGAKNLMLLLETSFPSNDGAFILNGDNMRIFVQPLLPPIQLIIFGGWLDVVPLIHSAQAIGCHVVVVDSRQRQSSLRLFRDASSVLLCSPTEALTQIQFDARTVAVLMNHHFEGDAEALAALTQVSVPFIGTLGPKRRQQKLLEATQGSGIEISDEFRQNLHGPVGLDIGAKTPEEIALSITSEILAVLNQRNAKPIRERLTPLHVSTAPLAYA